MIFYDVIFSIYSELIEVDWIELLQEIRTYSERLTIIFLAQCKLRRC